MSVVTGVSLHPDGLTTKLMHCIFGNPLVLFLWELVELTAVIAVIVVVAVVVISLVVDVKIVDVVVHSPVIGVVVIAVHKLRQ